MQEIRRNRPAGILSSIVTALLASGPTVADDAADLEKSFDRDSIVIESSDNACYRFDVYLALTPSEHRRGLMEVRELPEWSGMLFVYPDAARRSMWMKNTYIPLDMLFIRTDGTIASIATDTEPLSLRSIASGEPVTYVLELNAGITQKLGIDTDSRVDLPELP